MLLLVVKLHMCRRNQLQTGVQFGDVIADDDLPEGARVGVKGKQCRGGQLAGGVVPGDQHRRMLVVVISGGGRRVEGFVLTVQRSNDGAALVVCGGAHKVLVAANDRAGIAPTELNEAPVDENDKDVVENEKALEGGVEAEVAKEGGDGDDDGHRIDDDHQPLDARKVNHLPEDEQQQLKGQKDLDDDADGHVQGHGCVCGLAKESKRILLLFGPNLRAKRRWCLSMVCGEVVMLVMGVMEVMINNIPEYYHLLRLSIAVVVSAS